MSSAFEAEGEDLSIRGEIATTSVPELLRSLMQSGETGLLVLHNGELTKSVYLSGGRVVFAASSDPDERLGENLLRRGKLTARQYLDASRMIRPGRRLGAILVEMSALESEDLIPAVEQQVKDILMELFTWTRGEYEFVIKDREAASDIVSLNISTENLILEGIRRTKSWSRVLRGIRSIDAVPVATAATDASYKLELSEDEQEVLSHVNGRASVEQICQVSYLTHFETCRTLWAFQVLGLVRQRQAGDAEVAGQDVVKRQQELDLEGVVEQFNQMFSRMYGFLKGRMGEGVDTFMSRALDEVSRQYGRLFDGVDLRAYGRADYETMLANVADLPAEQRRSLMVAGLNELVFVLQLAVRTDRGKEEEAVVSGIIKEGFKRIGPA
jgi:hypothetical protein